MCGATGPPHREPSLPARKDCPAADKEAEAPVNVLVALVVLLVVTAVTVSAMLLVRRGAPEGSYFADGDRASGVFGVLATGFSVLLGFIIFLAFSSYDESRQGAETEATIVAQQVQTAQFLPSDSAAELSGELMCYARSVAGVEWDALDAGTLGNTINPWGAELYRSISTVQPATEVEQSAYDRWMDQTRDREQARIDRVHGAEGIIPGPLWLALFMIAGVIFGYMLFFADSGERVVTQAMLMGSVTVVISLLLFLLVFFDHPHGKGFGRLQPTAMNRTVSLIDTQLHLAGLRVTPPCDEHGRAT
jgi:protein-S-isoprenylcysteine O-methyltransferase Ste14